MALYIYTQWQHFWQTPETGRIPFCYNLRIKNLHNLEFYNDLVFFFHESSFLTYLHHFHFALSSLCTCGGLGNADHFLFHCPLISPCYLKKCTKKLALYISHCKKILVRKLLFNHDSGLGSLMGMLLGSNIAAFARLSALSLSVIPIQIFTHDTWVVVVSFLNVVNIS